MQPGRGLILTTWNIYHTYSTFLRTPVHDLREAAAQLINSGLATLAYLRDGNVWGRGGAGQINVKRRPYAAEGTFKIPSQLARALDSYELECLGQAVWMDIAERYLLGDPRDYVPEYVRAFLTEIQVENENKTVHIYPQVKLYENGVVLTEFRVLSGEAEVDVQSFIDDHLNLFRKVPKTAAVPPGLMKLYARHAWMSSAESVGQREGILTYLQRIEAWIDSKTSTVASGDFHFPIVDLATLEFEDRKEEIPPLSLRFLAEMVETAVVEVLFRTSPDKFVSGGPQLSASLIGGFWSGRPSVYILRYKNQPRKSPEIHTLYASDLARIANRSAIPPQPDKIESDLGPNLRQFEDYLLHFNKAGFLWVWSRGGLREEIQTPNANFGQQIYDKQIQVEFVEYLYAAHRQLEEASFQHDVRIEDIVTKHADLGILEESVLETSHFGELTDFFRHVERVLELDKLRDRIRRNLDLRGLALREAQQTAVRRFGWLLAFILGLASLSNFAGFVVIPAWKLTGWPMPSTHELRALWSFVIAWGFVGILGLLAWYVVKRRTP
jgi:hypothetical protein